jgi:hypothetical protein
LSRPTDNLDLSKHFYEEVHSIKEAQDQESRTRLHSDLKAWLGVYDCQALHEEALAAWQADTGKWFLQGHFASWSSWRDATFDDPQAAPILWLRGKSGSGKTTMLSAAINDYATRSSEIHGPPYAFFYCTFKVLSTQDPNTILSSFIAQLCDQRPNLWSDLVEGYREAKKKNTQHFQKPNLDELQSLLSEVTQKIGEIFLFLDGPNESEHARGILKSLGKVMARHSGLRLCVSTTPDLEVSTIKMHDLKYLSVNMEQSGMAADIEA